MIGKIIRKHIRMIFILIFILWVSVVLGLEIYSRLPMEKNAYTQVNKFVKALDYNRPEKIYPLLIPQLRKVIDKKSFIVNFNHERSYPYLTPLFIYVDSILFDDYKVGAVICTVASRLPGEYMEFYVRYIPFKGYYIDALQTIVDGSYIKIFDKLQ